MGNITIKIPLWALITIITFSSFFITFTTYEAVTCHQGVTLTHKAFSDFFSADNSTIKQARTYNQACTFIF